MASFKRALRQSAAGLVALSTAGFVSSALNAAPTSENPIELADAYIEAYSAANFENLADFYADDAVFTDPTSLLFGRRNALYDIQGKDNVIAALKAYVAQYGEGHIRYDVKQKFEGGGYVVYQAILHYDWGKGKLKGSAPISTIVHIEDGKVQEHRDYFDYRGAMKQQKKQ